MRRFEFLPRQGRASAVEGSFTKHSQKTSIKPFFLKHQYNCRSRTGCLAIPLQIGREPKFVIGGKNWRRVCFRRPHSVKLNDLVHVSEEPPSYPEGVKLLYLVYLCACLMERTWRFALPLVLANLEDGYRAVAQLGFVSPLACSALAPTIGRSLDSIQRPMGLSGLLSLQCISIAVSSVIVLVASKYPEILGITRAPIFPILLGLAMVEKLAAITSEVAIERDWVTQLCGKKNDLALATSNSTLRRMDLSCELVGSVSFGYLYSIFGTPSILLTTALSILICPFLLYLIHRIALVAPGAIFRESLPAISYQKRTRKPITLWRVQKRIQNKILHSWDGWKSYFRQPILPSSMVFVILFFNVALSPGGLLTAFLTSRGMDGSSLAVFRGACAIMGFVGTWCGKHLIQNFGLLNAGNKSLMLLVGSLIVSLFVYQTHLTESISVASGATFTPLLAFSAAIVISRVGLWSFDMVNAQLFQQNVSEEEVAATSSTEMALCSFSEILMLGIAAYIVQMESYSSLVYGSVAAVVIGAVIFRAWSLRLETRKTLLHM